MKKRKIAILINSMHGGGAERIVSYLLASLGDEYELHLVLLKNEIDYELPKGQIVQCLTKDSSNAADAVNILRIPVLSRRLTRYCRVNEIETVLSFLPRSNFVACFAKKLGLNARVLISERIYTPMWYRPDTVSGKVGRLLIKRLYPLADGILPNSQGTLEALRDQFGVKNKYQVVKNPVSIERVAELRGEDVDDVEFDRFTFVYLAGFREQKNHELLVRAFAALEDDTSQLLLIGKGELEEEIRSLVEKLGIEGRVTFLGHRSNPFKYLYRSDCFVLSSDFEGFPNVLIEALACGLPVISTDCPTGPRELLSPSNASAKQGKVEHAEYGVLVPGRDLEALTQAMTEMMQEKGLREKYAAAGPGRAAEYDEPVVMDQFRGILSGSNAR